MGNAVVFGFLVYRICYAVRGELAECGHEDREVGGDNELGTVLYKIVFAGKDG